MKGIIWAYTSRKIGKMRLEVLVDEYKKLQIGIARSRINAQTLWIEFDNGDEWEVVLASDTARGRACNVSLIESCTPKDIVDEIILPCTKSYPYRAYNYYFTGTDMAYDL